jgi:hypothetical protein
MTSATPPDLQLGIINAAGSWTGNARNRIASMTLKTAVLAPIPSANDSTAMAVNSG